MTTEPSKYFQGKPCRYGHTERFVANGKCVICNRKWVKEYAERQKTGKKLKPRLYHSTDFQHRVFVLGNPNIN
ncbi:hypothetical protein [Xenorhabdus ishibashii]|uniref:Uncharacterized protein n=1 Tax=Xenorhabdus ishibashii TaxID=1034471 RepID=A0A2D0KCU5_9GAMM|nr:hypothetical protein [Xenorhabdus ishibashii]PHM61243.1 hypothetical protein Xish_00365 [Xenorhabdus ishibashii]